MFNIGKSALALIVFTGLGMGAMLSACSPQFDTGVAPAENAEIKEALIHVFGMT